MSRPYAGSSSSSGAGTGSGLPHRSAHAHSSRFEATAAAAAAPQPPWAADYARPHVPGVDDDLSADDRYASDEDDRRTSDSESSGSESDSSSASSSGSEAAAAVAGHQRRGVRREEHERKRSTSTLIIDEDDADMDAQRWDGRHDEPNDAAAAALHMRLALSDESDRLDDAEQEDLLALSAGGARRQHVQARSPHTHNHTARAARTTTGAAAAAASAHSPPFGSTVAATAAAAAAASSPHGRSPLRMPTSPERFGGGVGGYNGAEQRQRELQLQRDRAVAAAIAASPAAVQPSLDYAVLPATSLPPQPELLHSPLSPVPLIGTPPPLGSPSSARACSPGSNGAGAPSTLALLHSLQSLHAQTSSMRQSLSHYLSFQSQALLELEEDVLRIKYVETALRIVREAASGSGGAGGGGGGGGHGHGHGHGHHGHLLHAPLHLSFTTTPTTTLLAQYSTACTAHLFDKRRLGSLAAGNGKPFGYAHEQEYRKLIQLVRARPSLLAFALANFQWQLMSGPAGASGPQLLSTHSPLIDPATVSHHRRSIEAVSQAVVWDVFGSGGAGGGSSGAGADGSGGGGAGGGGGPAAGGAEARKVGYVVRMTLRIMWEREVERMAAERRLQQQQQQPPQQAQQSPPLPFSPTSPLSTPVPLPAPLLPLHLFEHHAFLPRLLHELSLSCGGEFLASTLREIVHVVLVHDDLMDLSQDLVSVLAPPSTPTLTQAPATPAGFGSTGLAPGPADIEMEGRTPAAAGPMSPLAGQEFGAAAAGLVDGSGVGIGDAALGSDPVLAAVASFPPVATSAPSSCAASSPLPTLHGRGTSNLFDLCTTLLEKMHAHVDLIPPAMRGVARDMARLCLQAQRQHDSQFPSSPNAAAADSASSDQQPSLLPYDPNFELPATRLLSEYFFLHWLVAALLSPESYCTRHLVGGLTDNYPVSPLARRNLQAIGTVLIKLTSGSRFSSFSAAARAQQGQGQGQAQAQAQSPSASASAPASRLDRFLELHQPRVSAWLRRVIEPPHAQHPDADDRALEREMEAADAGDTLTVPRGWLPHDTAAAAGAAAGAFTEPPAEQSAANGWATLTLSSPVAAAPSSSGAAPASASPILLLPNDLFALHGLLKGCWNAAVSARVASAPRRKHTIGGGGGAGSAAAALPQLPPTPLAQLPLPAFPACLRAACDASASSPARRWLSPSCPFTETEVGQLLSCLAALGDVPHFVPAHENLYVCLDAALPALRVPGELAAARGQWPFDAAPLRHAADVLLGTLAQLPPIRPDGASECSMGLGALFRSWGAVHAHGAGSPSLAPLLSATESILRAFLPAAWVEDSFRPFLLAVQARLLREHTLLAHSSTLGSRLLHSWGGVHRAREGLAAREAALQAGFRAGQTRRLLELTRPKIRRLKKFLAAKTAAPMVQQQQQQPSPAASSGATAASLSAPSQCGGSCPDNPALDRLLCSACTRLLDRRRGLLRSFVAKYVIGEGVVITAPPVPPEGADGEENGAAAPAGVALPVATINAFAIPESSPTGSSGGGGPSGGSVGGGGGSGGSHSLLVSVGTGPPLDIRDLVVSTDIQDYILSSAYPELFVRCDLADTGFAQMAGRMSSWFQGSFVQFYVYMAVMDKVHDAARALAIWRGWRDQYVLTRPATMGRASSAAEEDPVEALGAQMGLTGHESIWIDLPVESGGPRGGSSGATKPREIRVPYLGARPFFAAYAAIRSVDSHTKPKAKLAALVQVRSLLLSTLSTSSFSELGHAAPPLGLAGVGMGGGLEAMREPAVNTGSSFTASHLSAPLIHQRIAHLAPFAALHADGADALHPPPSSGVMVDEVEAGSVEDFMSALCFLLLVSQPLWFVSNLHFLKSLYPQATQGCKAFVDALVAAKYLDGVWDTLAPSIRAQDAREEEARRDAEAERRRRENKAREEAEMQQQARELSRQIQEMQLQQQQQAAEALAAAQAQALAQAQAQADAQAQALEAGGSVILPPAHSPVLAATSAYELMAASPLGQAMPFALSNGNANGNGDATASGFRSEAAAATPPSGSGPVWSRLSSMGFAAADIDAALSLLAAEPSPPRNDETAFLVALDVLTVLTQAVDAGFDRNAALHAVQHAVGVRGLTLDKLTRVLQLNGMRATPSR